MVYKKFIWVLFACISFSLFSLTACEKAEVSSIKSDSHRSSEDISGGESPAENIFDGTYYVKYFSNGDLATDQLSPEYITKIEMNASTGKYIFTVNLLEGMGTMTGTFVVNGTSGLFTVDEKDFYGFTGEHITEFTMFYSDGYLVYNGDDCGAGETGDRYEKGN